MIFYPCKGESEGYTVKCKEKDFPISNYPLEQTEFFYAQKQARDKLEDEKNRIFDYSMFHHRNDTIDFCIYYINYMICYEFKL